MKMVLIKILTLYSFLLCSYAYTENGMQHKVIKKISKRYKETDSYNKLPFILDFPHYEDTPVVKIKLDNQYFFMYNKVVCKNWRLKL